MLVALVLAIVSSFVGSDRCGSCHPAEYEAWKNTPHARAADDLGARPRARCLACHGTGDAPAGKTASLEVGCEACHGAGRDYAEEDLMRDPELAGALGLRDPSRCDTCHRGAGTKLSAPTLDPKKVHEVP